MSISTGNVGIVTDNLQLYYSALSLRSFRGEATTNLVLNGNFATGDTSWTYVGTSATYSDPATFRGRTCFYANGMDNATARGYIYQSMTVTSGQSYTLSFKYFLVSGSVKVEISNAASSVITSTTTGRWITHKATVTTSGTTLTVSVLGNSASVYSYYYITDIQVENKAYATPYVTGSRSANTVAGGGGLLDLSGKANNASLNSGYVQFDTDGYYFNQLNTGCVITAASTSELYTLTAHNHTYDCWVKLLGSTPGSDLGMIWGREGWNVGLMQTSANALYAQGYYSTNTAYASGNISASLNTWYHFAYTIDVTNALHKSYLNGVQMSSGTLTTTLKDNTGRYVIGGATTAYCSNARVPICRAYNKALSASEVLRNYKAQKVLFP
jgi:hypothetical protein